MVVISGTYIFYLHADIGEALMLCKTKNVDLVLLDILLPGKDKEIEKLGFVFLERLKKNPKAKSVPVIILTNLNSIEDKRKGMKLEADDYLAKSGNSPQEVLVKVKNCLAKSNRFKKPANSHR